MKIQIKNLGPLEEAEFSLGDMTIICGENNTGKTYATYALFGFLTFWREKYSVSVRDEDINRLFREGVVHLDLTKYTAEADGILEVGCDQYREQLPMVFAAPAPRFQDTEFQVRLDPGDIQLVDTYERRISSANAERLSITKSEGSSDLVITLLVEKEKIRLPHAIVGQIVGSAIKDVIFGRVFPNPFIASAERTGAAIFRKELNFARNRLLEEMSQADKSFNPMDLLFKVYQDYALPVKNNVDFARQLETIAKRTSFIAEKHPDILADFADVIGGEYSVTENDGLYFAPRSKPRIKLSMDESSSAVRSLLNIGFYLRHVAQPGDLLMVDEPELNLHPENQRRVARLLARLVNLGIKVFLTTHSEYITKELNTLIMLNHDRPHLKRIAEREGYRAEELLSAERIRVYIAEKGLVKRDNGQRRRRYQTLTPADISPEYGIEARSFDATIETMNRIQEEIIWEEN
ncbi:AAA family ATPase [Candidatus Amarobacter glycogenicus]|uniref:AAA family ATPase n=1 Tax=Candidatus Amarobacter glycogenicus TaxID=3140699 RepID=UPI0031366DC2|nr:AAA family ATPase [Dehalococcoidia bacterium]